MNKTLNLFKNRFPAWLYDMVNPLILLGFGYITVFTPPMNARDPAGTKFVALAVLNLVAFVYLLFRKEQQPASKIFSAFFTNRVGFLYGLFLAVSLLSFFKAVNPAESLLAFTKLFTVFTAAMIIAAIFRGNKQYLTPVAIGMSLLLLIDAGKVFYQMNSLVDKYPNFADLYQAFINEVITDYSNKNILAAALFIKLPFALWLWTFKKGLAKLLGLVALFAGIMALMPVSTRAFYLGLAMLTLSYLLFIVIRFLVDRNRWKTALFSLIIVALIPLFVYLGWLGLSRIFPTARVFNLKDKLTERLETIKQDVSAGVRVVSWQRSVKLIKEDPLMGVGIGNWKINVMKYENRTSPDYIYYYYNHNDFIQTTAETGIPGGLLFLALFTGVGWAFLYALFKGPASGMSYECLFIPAFGLLCYSVDAFFNFPFDRPEIQSLWAIFLGSAMAFTPVWRPKLITKQITNCKLPASPAGRRITNFLRHVISSRSFVTRVTLFRHACHVFITPSLMILLLISSICLLYMNFRSLQLQALVKFELTKGELTAPASLFVAGFPFVPNVSVEGEPISVLKARYLINERRFTEAIDILKKDGSSPWETHREYFLSLTYNLTGNSDSAIAYGMKVFRQKPLYTANLDTLCRILENREHYTQADSVIGDYLAVFDGMGFSLAGFIAAYGDPRSKYINWQTELRRKAAIQRVEIYYYPALNEFNQKNYAGAADKYTKIVKLEPGLTEAWEKRAWCWFYLNEPKKCLSDLDTVMARGVKDPVLEELKKSVTHLTK